MSTTGNSGLDALADAIAVRVVERMKTQEQRERKRLYSLQEAAEYIGRSYAAVRNLVATGALPSHRRDRRRFIDREDLDRWIEMSKVAR